MPADVVVNPSPIVFRVWGNPTPKGSKRAFAVRKKDGTTRAVVAESSGEKLKDWTRRVEEAVQTMASRTDAILIDGPVAVSMHFTMPRPGSARTRDVWHSKRPDLDKLQRVVLDAMSGVVYHDDGQVAEIFTTKKLAVGDDDASRPRRRGPRLLEDLLKRGQTKKRPSKAGELHARGAQPTPARGRVMRLILSLILASTLIGTTMTEASASQYRYAQDVRVPSCKYRFSDGYSGHHFSTDEVRWTIKCAVRRWPVAGGAGTALCIARRESGLRAWARNAYSSAAGVYQFVSGTWSGVRSHLHRLFVHQRMAWNVLNGRANVIGAIRTAHVGGWGPWGGGC